MLTCSWCGTKLQTVDLPCPECGTKVGNNPIATEFSKTFTNRTGVRYRPDELVERMNTWLWSQSDLDSMGVTIQRDQMGLVNAVTLTCRMAWAPNASRFQFARLAMTSGFMGRVRIDLDDALNRWSEDNPGRRRVTHWVLSSRGQVGEVWLLFAEPAHAGPPGKTAGNPD